MTTIYILKLEHGCYYVGKTNNYSKSKIFIDHLTNNGALWTKLHIVIGEEKIIHNCSPFDEDRYVKEYMAKYGIDKVRGGSYVTKDLTQEQYDSITKEIWAANDACTRCGRNNHFIKDCYAKTYINNNIIEDEDKYKNKDVKDEKENYENQENDEDKYKDKDVKDNDEDQYKNKDLKDEEENYEDQENDKDKYKDKYKDKDVKEYTEDDKWIIKYNGNITLKLIMNNFNNFINSIKNTNKYYHDICIKKKINIIDFDNEYAKNIDKLYGEFLKYYILLKNDNSYITYNIHIETLLIWLKNPQTFTGELFNNISDKDKDFVSTIKDIHLSRSRFSRLLDIFAKIKYRYIEISNSFLHAIYSHGLNQVDFINNPNQLDEYINNQPYMIKELKKASIQLKYLSHPSARYIIAPCKHVPICNPQVFYGLEPSKKDYFNNVKIDESDFLDYIVDINSVEIALKPTYKNTKYYISKQKHLDSLNYLTSYCNEYCNEFEEILTNIPNICLANLKNKNKPLEEDNISNLENNTIYIKSLEDKINNLENNKINILVNKINILENKNTYLENEIILMLDNIINNLENNNKYIKSFEYKIKNIEKFIYYNKNNNKILLFVLLFILLILYHKLIIGLRSIYFLL